MSAPRLEGEGQGHRARSRKPGAVLDRLERRKDMIQVAVESAFGHIGEIAGILAGAGRDVTREIGEWATEVFEIRDAARRAEADETPEPVPPPEPEVLEHARTRAHPRPPRR